MAIESAADRLALLDDFGIDITGPSGTFTGIFDNAYVETLDIAGTRPVVLARTADLTAAGVVRGSALTIDGNGYTVAAPPETDGTGMTNLVLEEA
mgnify:CR=1 FL=1